MGDDGSTMTAHVGDVVNVVLAGNPSTGYSWHPVITEADTAILEQQGKPEYEADPHEERVGSGGIYTFSFKILAVGEAQLKLEYRRPWEHKPAAETFSIMVKAITP
jgi:inhibitor of cysteine peptidase